MRVAQSTGVNNSEMAVKILASAPRRLPCVSRMLAAQLGSVRVTCADGGPVGGRCRKRRVGMGGAMAIDAGSYASEALDRLVTAGWLHGPLWVARNRMCELVPGGDSFLLETPWEK